VSDGYHGPDADGEQTDAERRAISHGEARARFEQMKVEHKEVLKFVRDYRAVLDKLYADKATELIVRAQILLIVVGFLSALVVLVWKK